MNPYIKRSSVLPAEPWAKRQPKSVAPRRLVRHLLRARKEAVDALGAYMTDREKEGDGRVKILKGLGARV